MITKRGAAQPLVGEPMRGRISVGVAIVAVIFALSFAAWTVSYSSAIRSMSERLGEELALVERPVNIEIERFHALPLVLKEDLRVQDLIDRSNRADASDTNDYLQTVRDRTGAAEVFVMDASGITLAASNWQSPDSFVGHDYGFRPYFKDALNNGEGRFYAVGVTSGLPGYFLSSRIETKSGKRGVVVVKVDFAPLEAAWRQAGSYVAVADAAGVIFLTGRENWAYRPIAPLSEADLAQIDRERKYADLDIRHKVPLFAEAPDFARGEIAGQLMFGERPLSAREGWRLVQAKPTGPAIASANQAAALTALAAALTMASLLYLHQRRQLIDFKLGQNAVLEESVALRTRELAREVEERKRTEADLRDAQDELVQAARLAALGQMSAAIAHEVSQPLTGLELTLSAAITHADARQIGAVRKKLGVARRLTRRMQSTIRHLKTFAKKDASRSAAVDGVAAARGALELAEPRARTVGVEIRTHFAEQDAPVLAKAVRLEQVILNLLINALDAVEGRDQREVGLHVLRRDDLVCFRVTDNGAGIPVDIEGEIVKPFFTTKSGGDGLGLGLSISSTIVEDFGGTLHFMRNPGGGTICEVCLPALEGPANLQAAQ